MKSILLLLVTACLSSSVTFANESCVEGLVCEQTGKNEFVLREVRKFYDENLLMCATTTIANYGPHQAACEKAAQ